MMRPAELYIINQDEPYRSILMHLQLIIEHTIPDVELLFKWKIPFYYVGKRPICYLNQSKDYVDLGFWNAVNLTKHIETMTSDGRKIMKSLRYKALSDIDDDILMEVLKEAYEFTDSKI